MRVEGPGFLDRNINKMEAVKRSFDDLDKLESMLKKASKNIEDAKGILLKHKTNLHQLCYRTESAPLAIVPGPKRPDTSGNGTQ